MPDVPNSQILDEARRLICGVLREARISEGLTVRDVANEIRRSKSWVSRTESGARKLTVDEFIALAKLYKADPGELLRRATEHWTLPAKH